MSDLINRKYLLRFLRDYQLENYAEVGHEKEYNFIENLIKGIENEPTVEPVRGEWVYWKEQCEYCMNRNTCPYPENQEAMKKLEQWEKENKFWGSLKLICDYYVLDKDKYHLDNPPECNKEDEKND